MEPEFYGAVLTALSVSLVGAAVLLLTVPGLVSERKRKRARAKGVGAAGVDG